MTSSDIGLRLGRSDKSIRDKAKQLKLRKTDDLSVFDKQIRELASNQYSVSEIAKNLDLKAISVYAYLHRENIDFRKLTNEETLDKAREKSPWKKTNEFFSNKGGTR